MLKGILAGAAITFIVIVGAIVAGPALLPPEATMADRIALALGADAFVVLWLALSIGLLARHRFFTPEDIDGGAPSRALGFALTFYPSVLMLVLAVCMTVWKAFL